MAMSKTTESCSWQCASKTCKSMHGLYVIVRVPPLRVYGEYTRGGYDNFLGEAEEVIIRTESVSP